MENLLEKVSILIYEQYWDDSTKVIVTAELPAYQLKIGTVFASIRENDIWIFGLYVNKNYRKQGIAKILMQTLFDYFSRHSLLNDTTIRLEVNPDKAWLVGFYKSMGFQLDTDENITLKWVNNVNSSSED